MGHIQRHHLREGNALVPPQPLLRRADEIISPLFMRIAVNRMKMHTLGELRDTLLPRLISGKLRISDAEKLVASAL